MGQIKNIKLHIVTDIKSVILNNQTHKTTTTLQCFSHVQNTIEVSTYSPLKDVSSKLSMPSKQSSSDPPHSASRHQKVWCWRWRGASRLRSSFPRVSRRYSKWTNTSAAQ